jgi:hypothetical protein
MEISPEPLFYATILKIPQREIWWKSRSYRNSDWKKFYIEKKRKKALCIDYGARSVKTIEPETRVILTFTCWPGFAFAT